jgi:hypothetical protein
MNDFTILNNVFYRFCPNIIQSKILFNLTVLLNHIQKSHELKGLVLFLLKHDLLPTPLGLVGVMCCRK